MAIDSVTSFHRMYRSAIACSQLIANGASVLHELLTADDYILHELAKRIFGFIDCIDRLRCVY